MGKVNRLLVAVLTTLTVACGGGGGGDDPGAPDGGDGCDADCTPPRCGDGLVSGAEACDDGNPDGGDGCSAACAIEPGFTCAAAVPPEPSQCSTTCGDGVMAGAETCDDGNQTNDDGCDDGPGGTCRPTGCLNGVMTGAEECDDGSPGSGDGCDDNCTISRCGNGLTAGAETCDDGNLVAGDGCDLACATEPGWTCTAGAAPSTCATTCGDGIQAGAESCDDTAPAENGDGCSATCEVEAGWVCSGTAPSTCVHSCGNGIVDAGEECDDGNVVNTDACNTLCQVVNGCGDGNLDAGEQCDDDNVVSEDGCSSICRIDIGCPPGQAQVVSAPTERVIPDDSATGVTSQTGNLQVAGAVTKLVVVIQQLDHTATGQLALSLISPRGVTRSLSTHRGGTGDNFRTTVFDDIATTPIAAGTAPFTGRFKPEQSLSSTAGTDLLGAKFAGVWGLKAVDGTALQTGTIRSWFLTACVDPAAPYCGDGVRNADEECDDNNAVDNDSCSNLCTLNQGCGDGNLDAGEACDDNNILSGDGCSSACQPDITCGAGEQMWVVSSTAAPQIPDNTFGVISKLAVPTAGLVRKVIPIIDITHAHTEQLDIFLESPRGVQRVLTNDVGGTNYRGTIFIDTAPTSITSAAADHTGVFRPVQSLSSTAGFANQQAQGDWMLRIGDDTPGDGGMLRRWSLAVCIDPSAPTLCGNGVVETGETCDDANTTAGDGCSPTCAIELGCAAGQSPVVVSAQNLPLELRDCCTPMGSVARVTQTGTVARAVVAVGTLTHQRLDTLTLELRSPGGSRFNLARKRGGGGDNYVSTIFDDNATVAIASAVAPMRGRFRPEVALTAVNAQSSAGDWTLAITDDTDQNVGVLVSWTIGLCLQ